MKINIWNIFVIVVLVVLLFNSCNAYNYEKTEEYLYKVNTMIKDMDFYIAKAYENKIALYNAEQEMIKEIPFKDYDGSIKFIYARRKDCAIYFIISGSVDDEHGIMFVNDDSDGFLDGIKTINRIRGNSYQYNTN